MVARCVELLNHKINHIVLETANINDNTAQHIWESMKCPFQNLQTLRDNFNTHDTSFVIQK